jgi:hypothetical protein
MKISKKQKAILKSYARGVLVSFLTFLASNELGLDPAVSVIVAALAGPAARALDASDPVYGIGANAKHDTRRMGWLWSWRYALCCNRRASRIYAFYS